ncbi:hypothetical protein FAZ97_15835 [Paraburkholderia acidiphila]|uniref:Uncharacterized protein n=1 Tax=Paraburkholderia acidiphila TaxID=2571747 RepID=A0A7Z2JAG8_9BURK|nr:hypothetical protein FAZ97_15835 [Paraburkholderia acidiphila]
MAAGRTEDTPDAANAADAPGTTGFDAACTGALRKAPEATCALEAVTLSAA